MAFPLIVAAVLVVVLAVLLVRHRRRNPQVGQLLDVYRAAQAHVGQPYRYGGQVAGGGRDEAAAQPAEPDPPREP